MNDVSFEIILTEPLTHNECLALIQGASEFGIMQVVFHGDLNLILRIEFDSDISNKPIRNQVMLIAGWLGTISAVEIIGRIRKIEDYYTDFISDEIKTLTKHKEET